MRLRAGYYVVTLVVILLNLTKFNLSNSTAMWNQKP